MQDTPPNTELLAVVAEFLRRDVVPALNGSVQFQTRVAANVIDRVRRALEQPAAQAEAERRRLETLLDLEGDYPRSPRCSVTVSLPAKSPSTRPV